MKERKRKHDDIHFQLSGKGKRATKPRQKYVGPLCECDEYPRGFPHLCKGAKP